MTLLVACRLDGPRSYTYPNPELDALRISGVKYRIGRGIHGVDTLHVMAQGGVEHVSSGFMFYGRTLYDNKNLVQTEFFKSDINDQNEIMFYHVRDARHIVLSTVEIDGDDWRQGNAIPVPIDTTTRVLEFDDSGRFIREIDTVQNRFLIFTYNDQGLPATCTEQGKGPASWVFRRSYEYDVKGRLTRMVDRRSANSEFTTHYYSQGLLDSLVSSEYGTLQRYEHIFY